MRDGRCGSIFRGIKVRDGKSGLKVRDGRSGSIQRTEGEGWEEWKYSED